MELGIEPAEGMFHEGLSVSVAGGPASTAVELRATVKDADGVVWSSSMSSSLDANGQVVLDDARELLWSMRSDRKWVPLAAGDLQSLTVAVTAEAAGESAAGSAVRRFLAEGVRREVVRAGDLRGVAFLPDADGPVPGVVVLGGSEGGLATVPAALLAAEGYATLALAYFAHDDLPTHASEIPVEYFIEGLRWLRDRPEVGERVGVVGHSKGGEVAVVIASRWPELGAAVSWMGSALVLQGLDFRSGPRSSWTWEGAPLPFMPTKFGPSQMWAFFKAMVFRRPIELVHTYAPRLRDGTDLSAAEIALGPDDPPVLLVGAEDDRVAPSAAYARRAMERLSASGARVEMLVHEDAGHLFFCPNMPTTSSVLAHPEQPFRVVVGGSPAGQAEADRQTWRRTVAFFDRWLRER